MAPPGIGRALHLLLLAPLMVASACVFGSKSSASTSSQQSSPGGCLLQIDTAVSGIRGDLFAAVAGSGPDDYWAVGTRFEARTEASVPGPLAQHWTGSKWETVLAGGDRFPSLQLTDVAPLSVDDVWAVGFSDSGASSIHWDGTTWTELSGANGSSGDLFNGLAAVSPTDLWVVGKTTGAGGYDAPLVERSNGSSWTAVPVPAPDGIAAGLRDVSASGPRSLWAVGWSVDRNKVFRPLLEHWDGSRWTIVTVPHPDSDALLSSVAVVSPDDVWAVGWSWQGDTTRGLTLHWNGRTWSPVSLPFASGQAARLATVTFAGGVLGVAGQAPDENGILQPVALSLSGSTWTDHAVPVEPGGGGFQGLLVLDNQRMVAVGSQIESDGYGSLVQEGC